MKISISCLLAGVLFGCGLTVSQMINPAKVISFLDISGSGAEARQMPKPIYK